MTVKINITASGDLVTAKMGDKYGVAKCSPDDEFDIFVGAKLALDRLEKKCKPYGWLKKDVEYYFPRVDIEKLYDWYKYDGNEIDERFISRRLVFKTKEEAIEAAKKMLAVLEEAQDDET